MVGVVGVMVVVWRVLWTCGRSAVVTKVGVIVAVLLVLW